MLVWVALLAATLTTMWLVKATAAAAGFAALAECAQRTPRILAYSGVSEANKERAMRLLSIRLAGRSLTAGARLMVCALPFLALLALDTLHLADIRAGLMDWRSNLALLAVVAPLGLLQSKRRAGSGERLLQRLTLGAPAVSDLSFDIEVRRHGAAARAAPGGGQPVFVTGLARGGTTILTRLIYASGDFATPIYRDLPFPLAPNTWAAVNARSGRAVEARERGHGDGIVHDLDSPEAIEEHFWLTREDGRYRTAQGLEPMPPAPQTIADFATYTALVRLRGGAARYLSKNNNNVLRLPALAEAFPDAILLHPFRDPLQQACSLLAQHRRATELSLSDPFSATFMHWLGHHEFGPGLRAYQIPGAPGRQDDPGGIDYWLRLWIAVHRWLLDGQPEAVRGRQVFVDYDALCLGAGASRSGLARTLGLTAAEAFADLRPPRLHPVPEIAPALAIQARALQGRLQARHAMW